ncbi:hypothetical protein ABIF65_003536 [Bradyrhizobium japonicum]|uniref:hypothetical protein n=1 Tax=Bradyrhizobium TaxID=374 RepID=UPI000421F83A|nr:MULTISPECIES: hypothetical protein [Bradyrhizobium]MBR0884072.1 hypothetical protein [Bradyrhizobium liaoningense]MBR1004247.1 hypothetical protein [Bradyrhizobium liaoningense]MBR1070523.1 hypothetical protein [Bradyrhizobium liaoningense]MCP1741553.1 hypothetical protein [Bradyrhizobium japonicum]MCP1779664.1 hypothetical protein [Bradyrhizobium japonicum]
MKRWPGRIISWLWNTLALGAALAMAFHIGQWAGYGKGARDIARLVTEMRQGGYAVDEPWDRGGI